MRDDANAGLDAGVGRSVGGTGRLFPDATLPRSDGGSLSLDHYRSRSDLVIVMLGGQAIHPAVSALLDGLAADRASLDAESGQVIAIRARRPGPAPDEWRWPFPLAFDADGSLHDRVGAVDAEGRPATALYVTDRYREIFATLRPGEPRWPAAARDVVQWLTFVNIQCPECSPPEW